MTNSHNITMLGAGLIGGFYAAALHDQRGRDRVGVVYSRSEQRASTFAAERGIPRWTTDLAAAVRDPDTDVVVVALPNHLHEEAIGLAAEAGKPVLCTKPLARNAAEAKRILATVERAGAACSPVTWKTCATPRRRSRRSRTSRLARSAT
jgi:predicted dehydrogenase